MNRLLNAPPDFFLGCMFTIAMCSFALYQLIWMRKQREESNKRTDAKIRKMFPGGIPEHLKRFLSDS